MISKKSVTGLASLLVLGLASCLSSHDADSRTVAVRAEGNTELPRTRVQRVEPEYVEAQMPPEMPAALPEERTGAPSKSHVWIAGEHTRRAGQWVWVGGHWSVPPRNDVVWVPGHWVPHLNGYAWIAGAWR